MSHFQSLKHAALSGAALAAALAAGPAQAYMGPGAGLGMLASLAAVAGAVLISLLGLLILPVRMIMKRRRNNSQDASSGPSA